MGCCGNKNSKVTFSVKGMSCGHCKMSVEKALQGVAGVSGAEVNLAEANVTVTFEQNKVSVDQLKAVVQDAGFETE